MRVRHFVPLLTLTLVALAFLLLGTLPALTQTTGRQTPRQPQAPGQGQWQGQGRQGQGGFDKLFDNIAKGGETLAISDAGPIQALLAQFARDQGIAGNSINREQFSLFNQQLMQKLTGGDADAKATMGDMFKQFSDWGQRAKQDPTGERAQFWADLKDKMRDDPDVKAAFEKIRAARDKALAAETYIEPYPTLDLEELNKRPVVYRAGKLPMGLPPWFSQLDTNRDGQVGLYEWRLTEKTVEEFQSMDRNGDGLLTAEEVLYFLAKQEKAADANPASTYYGPMLQSEQSTPVPTPTGNPNGKSWPKNGGKGKWGKGG